MSKPADDFEAVRLVVSALEPFDSKDRERIIRWAVEKLGMVPPPPTGSPPPALGQPPPPPANPGGMTGGGSKDIKSFIALKNPRSDNQLAAVVAFYYHFEAPAAERKDSVGKEELVDACRKAGEKQAGTPGTGAGQHVSFWSPRQGRSSGAIPPQLGRRKPSCHGPPGEGRQRRTPSA